MAGHSRSFWVCVAALLLAPTVLAEDDEDLYPSCDWVSESADEEPSLAPPARPSHSALPFFILTSSIHQPVEEPEGDGPQITNFAALRLSPTTVNRDCRFQCCQRLCLQQFTLSHVLTLRSAYWILPTEHQRAAHLNTIFSMMPAAQRYVIAGQVFFLASF